MTPFAYTRASSLAEAALAGAQPGAMLLAGGTNMVDLMRADVIAPSHLVDIIHLPQLREMRVEPGGLRFGALVRMAEAADDPALQRNYPMLAESLQLAASQQLRNAATLAGNLLQRTRCPYFRDAVSPCNQRVPGSGCSALEGTSRYLAVLGTSDRCIAAYPGDWGTALAAFDTAVQVQGPAGARRIPYPQLHVAYGEDPAAGTTLRPGEVITGIEVAATPMGRRSAYVKLRDRASYAFALASAAVALDMQNGRISAARVALGGVATKPWRSPAAEAVLVGQGLDEDALRRAGDAAFADAHAPAPVAWKIELGKRALAKAVRVAASREA